ncbi:unnamed protein product [Rotaria magnacalcarata]|uniref:Superoxide dismutase copper/zinc binding domain-containing protein n=1 Tax=Rotaria magnacalcarata TaxID=392030 RepID=A0A819YUR9_9BILA|nr:unnamed protein product [Rotaria magnacalcarata]
MPSQEDTATVRAVCVLRGGENNTVQGVVHFAQIIGMNQMKIIGDIQGLPIDRRFTIHVHEFGDLTNGPLSTGGRFNPEKQAYSSSKDQVFYVAEEFGSLQVNQEGQAKIDVVDKRLTLFGPSSIIGRSVVIIDEKEEDSPRVENEENKGSNTIPITRFAAGNCLVFFCLVMESRDRSHRSPAVIPSRIVATPVHNSDVDRSVHQMIERTFHEITQLSPPKQAAVGGISGIAAGYCFAKASKMVAFTIGASIIGLALANQSGYVDIHFDRLRDTAQQQLNNVQRVARANLPPTTTMNVDGEEIETFIDQSPQNIADSLKKFAMANLAITASFIGGFLLGVAFE